MVAYTYTRLDKGTEEIRLVTVLPGDFNHPIRLNIDHAPLAISQQIETDLSSGRLSLDELRKTLPQGWECFQNLEGRYIFNFSETEDSSWEHPTADFDRTLYEDNSRTESSGLVKYEALSYVWGSIEPREQVYLIPSQNVPNSLDHQGTTLTIGPNLASALRHLRREDSPYTLWIDAICINQEDLVERSEQVKRMHDIYRLASRVVVWLGPESPTSSLAMRTLDYIGHQVEYTRDDMIGRSPETEQPEWWDPTLAIPYKQDVFDSLLDLFSRGWFERTWIVQEIQSNFNATILCGKDSVSWYHFRRGLLCLQCKVSTLPSTLHKRISIFAPAAGYELDKSTTTLFLDSSSRSCTDSRDKLYGIMSLIPREYADKIEPDYSLPPSTIFRDATLAHIDTVRRLELLPLCGTHLEDLNWPSWVPSLVQPTPLSPIHNANFASSFSSTTARYIPDGILEIDGVTADTVISISQQFPEDPKNAWILIKSWYQQQVSRSRVISEEVFTNKLLFSLRLGRFRERFLLQSFPKFNDFKEVFERNMSCTDAISEEDAYTLGLHVLAKGRLLMTTSGVPCVGGPGAQEGDHLCVLLGCSIPILLRPKPNNQFQVVGRCFQDGLDRAEAILGPLEEQIKVQMYMIDGAFMPRFFNSAEDKLYNNDPRLGDLPAEWEKLEVRRTRDDPLNVVRYRNKESGEIINSDPRLFPDALRARGVALETYRLI